MPGAPKRKSINLHLSQVTNRSVSECSTKLNSTPPKTGGGIITLAEFIVYNAKTDRMACMTGILKESFQPRVIFFLY